MKKSKTPKSFRAGQNKPAVQKENVSTRLFGVVRSGFGRMLPALALVLANATPVQAAPGQLAQTPLTASNQVSPNLMMLLDTSGSMRNIVPEKPFVESTYSFTCPAGNIVPNNGTIFLYVANESRGKANAGHAWFGNDSSGAISVYKFGTFPDPNIGCFDDNLIYQANLYAVSSQNDCKTPAVTPYATTSLQWVCLRQNRGRCQQWSQQLVTIGDPVDCNYGSGNGTGATPYSGKYLNWYFAYRSSNVASIDNIVAFGQDPALNDNFRRSPAVRTRMEVAQNAASEIVKNIQNMNLGLASFNAAANARGTTIRQGIDSIDNNRSTLLTAISGLSASGGTPLGEAHQGIARYFLYGTPLGNSVEVFPNTANASSARTAGDIFTETVTAGRTTETILDFDGSVSKPGKGVQEYWCQKNYVASLTDGLPTSDSNVELFFKTGTFTNVRSPYAAVAPGYTSFVDGSSNDFMDDVIAAMHDIDLRPDLCDPDLLKEMGLSDCSQIREANVPAGVDKSRWKDNITTYMIAFAGKGLVADPGDPKKILEIAADNGGGGGVIIADDTEELVNAFQDIVSSIRSDASAGATVSVTSSLSAIVKIDDETDQKTLSLFASEYDSGEWSGEFGRYDYDLVKDKASGEIKTTGTAKEVWLASKNIPAPSARKMYSYDPAIGTGVRLANSPVFMASPLGEDLSYNAAGKMDGKWLARTQYLLGVRSGEATGEFRKRPDNNILGDIVHSSSVVIPATAGLPYQILPKTYQLSYRSWSKALTRQPAVIVGANDGFLHSFNADTGAELFAFSPSFLASTAAKDGLHYLTDPNYVHRYYMDGPTAVSDAYINGGWKTVAVGSAGAGGKGIYALNVTNSENFAENRVMWEFTHPDLGYTAGQNFLPFITVDENDNWVAIVPNGYDDELVGDKTPRDAKLFIIKLEGPSVPGKWVEGIDYWVISTNSLATEKNGLSVATVVDTDGNGMADRAYAGDILGDMWAFDLKNLSATKLFDGDPAQPITSKPAVAQVPADLYTTECPTPGTGNYCPNVMVFFGTGQYLTPDDPKNTDTQFFMGVWDNGQDYRLDINDLMQIQMVPQTSARIIQTETLWWEESASYRGWFIELDIQGERSTGTAGIGYGAGLYFLVFNSIVPDVGAVCGGVGDTWFWAVNPWTGNLTQLDGSIQPFRDANNDGVIDAEDAKIGSEKLDGVIIQDPVISEDNQVWNCSTGTNCTTDDFPTDGDGTITEGRLGWQEQSSSK